MKIVLINPEIPPNTGSIGRLCAATNTSLVLVEPLGFSLDNRYLKRAGLDYWPWIDVTVTSDWRAALSGPGRPWLFTARTERSFQKVEFGPDDMLVFGCETKGLSDEVLKAHPDQHVRIPMENDNIRSLNLAQCAAIGLYEMRRQLGVG
jgi:tRNA (cytidine/uridine-2'-O-)-methyltransferase